MSIFFNIKNLSYEDITTEILVCALQKSSALREKFLELAGLRGKIILGDDIETQYRDTVGVARPDICIKNKGDFILFVENKPWIESTFTPGETGLPDQINRYAKELYQSEKKADYPNKRILCLLTRQYNLNAQLAVIAENEGITISPIESKTNEDVLREHFAKPERDIAFVALTWEHLLDSLKSVTASDAVECKLILDSLTEDIITSGLTNVDPTAESFKAHFTDFKRLADEATDIVHRNSEISIRPVDPILHYTTKSGNYSRDVYWYGIYDYIFPWGMFQWGPHVYDYEERLPKLNVPLPNHPFTFNVILHKNPKTIEFKKKRIRTPIFDLHDPDTEKFFEENGFHRCEEDWATIYIKPFDFGDVQLSEITPALIADKVIEFAKEYSEACEKFIGLK